MLGSEMFYEKILFVYFFRDSAFFDFGFVFVY